MSVDWAAKREKAAAKIAAKGAPALIRRSVKAYDPVTDKTVTEITETPCSAVLSTLKGKDEDRREMTLTAATITERPEIGDDVVIAGVAYPVTKVLAIAPAGVAVVWSAVLG